MPKGKLRRRRAPIAREAALLVGAFFVALAASSTFAAKTCLFYLFFNHLYHGDRTLPTIMVFSLCYIPSFLHACLVLHLALGIKKGMSIIIMHPALVMLPTLTCVTFRHVPESGSIYKKDESRIQFSWWLTWVNMIMTICGIAVAYVGVALSVGFEFYFYYDLFFIAIWLAVAIFLLTMSSCLCRPVVQCSPFGGMYTVNHVE